MTGSTDGDQPSKRARAPTRRYEARRNAIIASAVKQINAKGVRGMTLADVAAGLGLVPTGVIYYFRNKEELAAACFLRAAERFDALIADAAGAEDDRARLLGFIRGYIEFKRQAELGEAEQIAMFNDARALGSPVVGEAYIGMFRHARELLKGPPTAPLSRLDRSARTHLLLSELFWSEAWLRISDVEDYGRVAERMGAVLADGLLPPGREWPQIEVLPLVEPNGEASGSAELFLRAATELINEEGYHGASVERIAARLNVSKGAFYHHNATKDELVVACFQRSFRILWRAIRASEARGGSGLVVLARACVALAHHQIAGELPLLRASALTAVPETMTLELTREFNRISMRIASVICDGVADGSIRPVDVNVAAQLVNGMINAAVDLKHWASDLTPEGVTTHYVRPLFEGLLAPLPAQN